MMALNKMLIGGAAVFATVSLIGCKDDDDDDSCAGVDLDLTKTSTEIIAAYGAIDADCATCLSDEGLTTLGGYGVLDAALQKCGGSVILSEACKDVEVTQDADIARDTTCGVCMIAWDIALAPDPTISASGAEAAYKGCSGDKAWPSA